MSTTIKTDRLVLRPFQESDIDSLYEIQRNKEAMQYTFCDQDKHDAKRRFTAYGSLTQKIGFAPWTVLFKPNEEIIGWGGLNEDPFDPGWGVEVAYFIHPDYWGKGLATELVQVSLEQGFNEFGLDRIGAFVHRKNIASARVLEKCGFEFVRYEAKLDRNYYVIHR